MEKLPAILLVDHDDTTNFLNEHLLKKLGVADQVRVATNGQQALALLTPPSAYAPALLLLDVKMPVLDGIGFLEAYQHLPPAQQADTVVVVLTTSVNSGDLARLDQLPIAGVVSKPLTREKVDTLLRQHFGRQLPAE